MSLKITIDIFSGRSNPVIELTENETKEAIERLQPVREIEKGEKGLPPEPTLGYRGLIIEQTGEPVEGLPRIFRLAHGDLFGLGLFHRARDEAFEDFVCGSTHVKNLDIEEEFPGLIKTEIERFREVRSLLDPQIVTLRERRLSAWWPCRWWWPCCWWWFCCWWWRKCKCAPLYEATWWNDTQQAEFIRCRHNDDYANYDQNPDRKCPFFRRTDWFSDEWFSRNNLNNCYNYATNYRTDTFAQPGRASAAMYDSLTGDSVKAGAIKDDLIDSPDANNKCPDEGHLVALVIWPGVDYHWYRKGRNKYWSHKPGSTNATNLDNSGVAISDPRTADRGGYVEFCTFMVVMHGHIKII